LSGLWLRGLGLLGGKARGTGFSFLEDLVVLFLIFGEEIGYVEESIPFQPDIHERRLHAGQDAAHSPLVNTPRQAYIRVALVIHFHQLVVFQHGDLRLVRRR
jgi:hypothetical protein